MFMTYNAFKIPVTRRVNRKSYRTYTNKAIESAFSVSPKTVNSTSKHASDSFIQCVMTSFQAIYQLTDNLTVLTTIKVTFQDFVPSDTPVKSSGTSYLCSFTG